MGYVKGLPTMTTISNLRIHVVFLLLGQLLGMEAFHIELDMPHYVEKGRSVILYCNYSIPLRKLYKIEWQKNEKKIYQYVKDRRPPKRNFTIPGGAFDWNESDERQLKINNINFTASGYYSCSASMEQPIYTKFSDDVQLRVFEKQQGDPQITLRKAAYAVGEVLELNCTSEPARPSPAVTWLLNGKEVDYSYLKKFYHSRHQNGEHLTFSTTQLTLNVMESHVGPSGFVELTCISTIPAYLDDEEDRFADKRIQTISVEVFHPQPTAAEATDGSSGNSATCHFPPSSPLVLLVLLIGRLVSYG